MPQPLSILGKSYQVAQADDSSTSRLTSHFDIPHIIARLLVSRNVPFEQTEAFLAPTLRSLLPDPFHLLDMQKATTRLAVAIKNRESIAVFGDYDVDGGTSSALLFRFLEQLKTPLDIYIPNRITEGYGPSVQAMDTLKSRGHKVVITVDCGAVAFEAINHATKIGLDVIILDHHIGAESLPNAVAIVNPNRLDETSNCRDLAAVGVCFLTCIALTSELAKQKIITPEQQKQLKAFLINQLDLVGLGTVCDVMPITGLNRAFVKQGLEILKRRQNIGLRALSDIAKVNSAPSTYHLGFALGPRINAGGRIGQSDLGARLLITHSEAEAADIAAQLDRLNQERRAIEQQVQQHAMELAASQTNQSLIFVSDQNPETDPWHAGVIGIVASRLKDRFDLPAAVISMEDGDNGKIGKGSMRSVKGADVGAALLAAKAEGLLIAGGGHAMAGGFSVEAAKMDALQSFLNDQLAPAVSAYRQDTTRTLDLELQPHAIRLDLLSQIRQLEPYGVGNPEPRILLTHAKIIDVKQVGENHLRLQLISDGAHADKTRLTAMAFRALDSALGTHLLSAKGKTIKLIGKANENHWQDRITPQFIIDDAIIQ